MPWIRAARAIGGLATILVLLALVAADVLEGSVELGAETVVLLCAMVSALLGVDILARREGGGER